MTSVVDNPVAKFNPNTLEEVRKEFNLHHEGVLEQMVNNFEDWVSKQNHFTRRKFDRRYLEVIIMHCKGSLERAKLTLDKSCTLKTLLPQFFSKSNVKMDMFDMSTFLLHGTMPRLLNNNYRLYIIKMLSSDFDSSMLLDFHRMHILMNEYVKFYDYFIGLTLVIDLRNINLLSAISKINILDLRNGMAILIEGYSLRINGIHLLSSSKSIDLFIGILKQVISPKLANRIHVHETMDTLYKDVPQTYFPEDYGGDEKPLKTIHENWVNFLSTEKNVALFKDICKAGTVESKRLANNYNEHILGMPGSFRTLVVD